MLHREWQGLSDVSRSVYVAERNVKKLTYKLILILISQATWASEQVKSLSTASEMMEVTVQKYWRLGEDVS